MFVPDLFTFVAGIIIVLCVWSTVTRNRRFYQETAQPITSICAGVLLGLLLQDEPPLIGIAYITVIVVIPLMNWKKLIGTVTGLFRTIKVK